MLNVSSYYPTCNFKCSVLQEDLCGIYLFMFFIFSFFLSFFTFYLQLLNKRIENFINSYSNNISYPDAKPYVSDELMKLLKRWDDFKNQSAKLKSNLSLAQQYFSLLENVSKKISFFLFFSDTNKFVDDEIKKSLTAVKNFS